MMLLLPQLQQYSAVRQLTSDSQQRKPRDSKRPQTPPYEAGSSTKRIVHTAVNEQKLISLIML